MTEQVASIDIDINIIQGQGLVAKDRKLFGKATSDPYVEIYFRNRRVGKTKTIKKTLSPVWKELFHVKLGASEANSLINGASSAAGPGKAGMFEFRISDKDTFDDDPMGTVSVPIQSVMMDEPREKWYRVEKGSGSHYCKDATGELKLKIAVNGHRMLHAVRGNTQKLDTSSIRVGLGWEMEYGQAIDLDSACVAIDNYGSILMNETVYYGNLRNSNGSIYHSGDEREGDEDIGGSGDDEIIMCQLNYIPPSVRALYFILTTVTPGKTFADVKSARATVIDAQSGRGLFDLTPSLRGQNTALFLMRVARDYQAGGWTMAIIDGRNPHARDFGTLVPEIKGFSQDLVPNILINPRERVAVMRKGGNIRLIDYCRSPQKLPEKVTFGLAWDVTDGVNIDLDASAICFDKNLNVVDVVFWKKLRSDDGSIIHGGDEREGDEIGDDEKIYINLGFVHLAVEYIAIVINSYSGQELDDVARASCHLFDSAQGYDFALYTLSNAKELDKHTALIMGCLYRGNNGEWCLRIISEPAQGKLAHHLQAPIKQFLHRNPPQPPAFVPEDEEIVIEPMPDVVPIEDEIIVAPVVPMYQMNNAGQPTYSAY